MKPDAVESFVEQRPKPQILYITFLNFPSIKSFEIRQKLGREDIIASETFFTISKIACHIGSLADFATKNENAINKVIFWSIKEGLRTDNDFGLFGF